MADKKTEKKDVTKAAPKKPVASDTKKPAAKKAEKPAEEKKAEKKKVDEVKAKASYVRVAPRKARLVVDQIRGLAVDDALNVLRFTHKAAKDPIAKLLNSAIANATNNFDLEKDQLFVKKITADDGPTIKRFRPRAFGRSSMIRKRTSHINIVLGIKSADDKSKKVDTKKTTTKKVAAKAK